MHRLAVLLLAVLSAQPARAGEAPPVCVACKGPEVSYVCRVSLPEGSAVTANVAVYCLTEIARQHGHASCAIRRGTSEACAGSVVALTYQGEPAAPAALAGPAPEPAAAGAAQEPPVEAEPKTLVEMTAKASKQSQKQWQAAGRSMQELGQKTWTCLSSLFKSCQ